MSMDERAFIDRIELRVKAGNGGPGAVSFRREAHVPRGGPDGGDGGKGGDVIFEVSPGETTLISLHAKRFYQARNGESGQGANKTGAGGQDLVCLVPPGTVVCNAESGELVADLTFANPRAVIAKGGDGGKGNARFASSVNQAPRKTTPGFPGEDLKLVVELKIIADVGLVGFPNAGKSTLLNKITGARAKIASYPFTTLHPVLGSLILSHEDQARLLEVLRTEHPEVPNAMARIIIADIPGILEGAHTGVGLGVDFLKHIERTAILMFVLDACPQTEPLCPVAAYHALLNEISAYNEDLLARPRLLVLNKCDLLSQDDQTSLSAKLSLEGHPVCAISALQEVGVAEVSRQLVQLWFAAHEPPSNLYPMTSE